MIMIEDARVYNVRDMYLQSKEDNKPLLSTYGGANSFWSGYKANYSHFDRLFMRKFTSLIPLDQEYKDGIEDITDEFRADVYAWLMANDKRYSELFRVNSIADDTAYSLTNNVDYTETINEQSNRDIAFNKGRQTNNDSITTEYGSQEVEGSTSTTYGDHDRETTTTVSAYNTEDFVNDNKVGLNDSEHTDSEETGTTYGSHTDERSGSYTEGSRTDTTEDDTIRSSTLHKIGNMGVQTVDDMLHKHWENWTLFDFYGLIFDDIAANLLRGC